MKLNKQKELAARTLGVSKNRVKILPKEDSHIKDLKDTISREGIKELLGEKIIIKVPKKGISKTRAKHIAEQKKKGRRQGSGSRKGTSNARYNSKEKWMVKIRALRLLLKNLKISGQIDVKDYKSLYKKAKGNFFRNKRHLMLYMNQNKLIRAIEVEKKLDKKEVEASKKVKKVEKKTTAKKVESKK
jgi:large subunit ribosomal protein L19e